MTKSREDFTLMLMQELGRAFEHLGARNKDGVV
jgi:hypothetical protein